MNLPLWFIAATLTALSVITCRLELVMLEATIPAARLPWIRWHANAPRIAKQMAVYSVLSSIASMIFVFLALGHRHPYDILWGLPLALIAPVLRAVQQARHNRIVRRATA